MKRTRKWTFVAQEATRLAGLGLSPLEIAQRLDLSKSTVTRWIAAGKLPKPTVIPKGRPVDETGQTPQQWSATVRKDYALDATDDQLVMLAEAALMTARDPLQGVQVQLAAMGRFQTLVKQLALVARPADAEVPAPVPVEPTPIERTRDRVDPRAQLMKEARTIQ